MQLATFEDFISSNPSYKKMENNPDAIYIFNEILSKEKNIIAMIQASNAKKPALSACIEEVETYFDGSNKEFDLLDNFTKQGLGRMVKVILEPFGYRTFTQKDMPKGCGARYVTSATVFQIDVSVMPRLLLKMKIVDADDE